MKGSDEVLSLLNELLTNELTAINLYLVQSRMCARWGYQRLATKFQEDWREETEHAQRVAARILFLEGTPNMERYHQLQVGATVREQLEVDLRVERDAVAFLERAIEAARNAGDNATQDLMIEILRAEQEDVDWIETQLGLVAQVGEQNYLAQQLA
jgi:bacterioferritin